MTLSDFHIDSHLNLNLDYVRYVDSYDSLLAICALNHAIFYHDTYKLINDLCKEGQDPNEAETAFLQIYFDQVFEEADQYYFEQVGKNFEGAVDLDEIVSVIGNEAFKERGDDPSSYEISGAAEIQSFDVDETGAMYSAISDPSDYEQDIADYTYSMNNLTKQVVVGVSEVIPYAGPAISLFVDIVWPEDDPTAAVLKRLYSDVNFLMEEKILAEKIKAAQIELDLVHSYIINYATLAKETQGGQELQRQFQSALDQSYKTLIRIVGAGRTLFTKNFSTGA